MVLQETTTLTEESLNVTNASEEEIYEQILEDIKGSEGLPAPGSYAANDVGRVTSGTRKILLAKVQLTRQDWGLASQTLKELVDSGWYSLYDDFYKVFDPAYKNGQNISFPSSSMVMQLSTTAWPGSLYPSSLMGNTWMLPF